MPAEKVGFFYRLLRRMPFSFFFFFYPLSRFRFLTRASLPFALFFSRLLGRLFEWVISLVVNISAFCENCRFMIRSSIGVTRFLSPSVHFWLLSYISVRIFCKNNILRIIIIYCLIPFSFTHVDKFYFLEYYIVEKRFINFPPYI